MSPNLHSRKGDCFRGNLKLARNVWRNHGFGPGPRPCERGEHGERKIEAIFMGEAIQIGIVPVISDKTLHIPIAFFIGFHT